LQLSEDQLQKFIEIYYKSFGVRLTKKEALPQALSLVRLIKVVVTEPQEEADNADYQSSGTKEL
jgi:hypothetical protein